MSEYPKTLSEWTSPDGVAMRVAIPVQGCGAVAQIREWSDEYDDDDRVWLVDELCARIAELEQSLASVAAERDGLISDKCSMCPHLLGDHGPSGCAYTSEAGECRCAFSVQVKPAPPSDPPHVGLKAQASSSAEGARSSNDPVNREIGSGKVQYQPPSQGGTVAALDPVSRPQATLDASDPPQVAGMPTWGEIAQVYMQHGGLISDSWKAAHAFVVSRIAAAQRPDRETLARALNEAWRDSTGATAQWEHLSQYHREQYERYADAALRLIPTLAPDPQAALDKAAMEELVRLVLRRPYHSVIDGSTLANIEAALRSTGRLAEKP